jgi:5'-3' exonuclease
LIEKKLNLNQPKLILFGMMLGSDYTEGIKGIGIVNAM